MAAPVLRAVACLTNSALQLRPDKKRERERERERGREGEACKVTLYSSMQQHDCQIAYVAGRSLSWISQV